MKLVISLVFLLYISPLWAQVDSSVVLAKPQSIILPVQSKYAVLPPFQKNLRQIPLPYSLIANPATRYAIQDIKSENYEDSELNHAVATLIRYINSENIQYTTNFLRNYARKNIPDQEKALCKLQQYITIDSAEYIDNMKSLLSGDYEEYLNTDLQLLVKYIQSEQNYLWLRNADRDSVFIELTSSNNSPIKFWMNNGKLQYYRFWAGNNLCDTVGTWVQVMPKGNKIKIYLDEDVFQTSMIEQIYQDEEAPIFNAPSETYFISMDCNVPDIKRRYWTYYSEVELTMSQGALKNWSSGGENSLSLISNLRYYWNYNRNKTSWENWMHYRFGFMKNGEEEMRKNEDRFELNSKVGQKAFKHWYYTAQFNMVTQLFNSYDYPKDKPRELVANFMSPGDFTLSLGMDYKPNSNFSLVVSPIAGKWTFVRDSSKIAPKRYGITEAGKRFKREAGAQVNLISKLNNLFKILNINNELKVFLSYEKKDKYITEEESGEMKKRLPLTVNWKMTIDFKINYFMTTSIYTETIYDESFSRKLQFKENLNLGVKFRF